MGYIRNRKPKTFKRPLDKHWNIFGRLSKVFGILQKLITKFSNSIKAISKFFWKLKLSEIFVRLSMVPKLAWDKIVMQCFLVLYREITHSRPDFSLYTHSPKGSPFKNDISHSWNISRHTTGSHCLTSTY